MKIGILTLYHHNNNYGGKLQAYALQKYITDQGHEAELIDYDQYPRNWLDVWLDRIYRNYRVLLHPDQVKHLREESKADKENRIEYEKILLKNTSDQVSCVDKFKEFSKILPHTREFNRHTIKEISDCYDAVVLGGDQIWNPDIFSKAYYGKWVKNRKKILSYSASAGKDNFKTYELKRMKKLLSGIPNISVREENLCELLKNLLKRKDIEHVLDPVFLLDDEDWAEILVEPEVGEKYIFAYLLNKDGISRKKISIYAQQRNLKIVTIPHARGVYNKCDNGFGDITIYDAGPLEFLGLINKAEYVFTDSFHGTCFSIIFHKEFNAITNTVDNENHTTNARLYTVLSETGLLDRLVDCHRIGTYQKQIEYAEVVKKLKSQKKGSEIWLYRALQATSY